MSGTGIVTLDTNCNKQNPCLPFAQRILIVTEKVTVFCWYAFHGITHGHSLVTVTTVLLQNKNLTRFHRIEMRTQPAEYESCTLGEVGGETDGNTNVSLLENENSTGAPCARGDKVGAPILRGCQWSDYV